MMIELENTLECAGIDPGTYCGTLYGWYMIRSGHCSMGRSAWLTKAAAKEALDRELRDLTTSERSHVSACYVGTSEWRAGQGQSVATWTVDPATGCYIDSQGDQLPTKIEFVRDHPLFSKLFPGL